MPEIRRDAARNRARIVGAARTLVASGGAIGFNAVAHAAEVGVGTVYRHFATVEELEEAVVEERFDELAAALADSRASGVEGALVVLARLLVDDPLFEAVASRAVPASAGTDRRRRELITELDRLLAADIMRGSVRAGMDAGVVLLLVCGVAHGIRAGGFASRSPDAGTMVDVVLRGIRA